MGKARDYRVLLKQFKRITMDLSMIEKFCFQDSVLSISYACEPTIRKTELFFKSERLNRYIQNGRIIQQIDIKKDGLYYKLTPFFRVLCDTFDLENLELEAIKKQIEVFKKISRSDLKSISKRLNLEFSDYVKENKSQVVRKYKKMYERKLQKQNLEHNQAIENKDNIKRKRNYKELDIEETALDDMFFSFKKELISDLIELSNYSSDHFQTVSKVPKYYVGLIDHHKLGFMLNFLILDRVNKLEKNCSNYPVFVDYIHSYLETHREQVEKHYKLCISSTNKLGLTESESYCIDTLVDFISSIQKEEKKEQLEKESAYSFLECKQTHQSREILGTYLRIGNSSRNNTAELQKLLEDKIDFYTNLGYVKLYLGADSFDGYIGFQLDNGIVILDKLYDNLRTGKIAKEDAIYITTTDQFEEVTKLSKPQCMDKIKKKEILAIRLNHNESWRNRIDGYCQQNGVEFLKTMREGTKYTS